MPGHFVDRPIVLGIKLSKETEVVMCFPTVVRVSEIPGHEALNKQILSGVKTIMKSEPNSIPQGWSCSLYTTIGSQLRVLDYKEFAPLGKLIMRESREFANLLDFNIGKHPLKITDCWLNVYDHENAQEIHVHPNNVISGIYYPKAPNNCGELLIHSPYGDVMLDPPMTKRNQFNNVVKTIKPRPGMMVLFRSFVRHSVKPNKSNERRVSVAFNLTM